MESNKNFHLQDDPTISALIDFLKNRAPKTCILNPRRYHEMLISKKALDLLLKEIGEDTSKIKFYPEFLSASISAEVDCFEVSDMRKFQIAMSAADNFEMYPLTTEKMRIAFSFNQIMTAIEM